MAVSTARAAAPRRTGAPDSGTAPGRRAGRRRTGARRDRSMWRTSSGVPCADDAALGDEVQVIDDLERLVDVVRDDDRRDAERVVQLADELADDAERDRVEPRERLVVEHEHRIERDRARERHATRHAARQLRRAEAARRRASPTACSFMSTRSRISGSSRSVCSRIGNATFSYTVMSVNSAPNWNSMPMRRRRA